MIRTQHMPLGTTLNYQTTINFDFFISIAEPQFAFISQDQIHLDVFAFLCLHNLSVFVISVGQLPELIRII